MRALRALACALGLSGMALACPPAPAPFVPFDGEPFRFRADLTDVAACSVAWFTLDESGIRSLDVDSSFAVWLLVEHESSFPLFLEPEQVVGPTQFDEVVGNRVTLDGRTFVVVVGVRFDRVYNEGIFMRLVFELPARPSSVMPAAPAAPPESTLVEVRRERWGAFEVVGETVDDWGAGRFDRVRIVDPYGDTAWFLGAGSFASMDILLHVPFGDGVSVLTVTGHYGGNCCAPVQHHFLQDDGALVPIAGSTAASLVDRDGDGAAERHDFVWLRLPLSGHAFDLPVVQHWLSATRDFGPVVTREEFPQVLESLLRWDRGRLDSDLRFGGDVVRRAVQVYAVAYYLDPTAAATEREHLGGLLPEAAAVELAPIYPEIEATIDAFVADAATWQPEVLGGD